MRPSFWQERGTPGASPDPPPPTGGAPAAAEFPAGFLRGSTSCGGGGLIPSGREGRSCPRERPPFLGAAQRLGEGRAPGSRAWSSLCIQVVTWLREKSLVALAEGWRDPARLRAQLWKQQDLEAQLQQQQRLKMARPQAQLGDGGAVWQARAQGCSAAPWRSVALGHRHGQPTLTERSVCTAPGSVPTGSEKLSLPGHPLLEWCLFNNLKILF